MNTHSIDAINYGSRISPVSYHLRLVFFGFYRRDPSMVEHILLEKGDTMIFNNHRALHARGSYKVPIVLLTSLETAGYRPNHTNKNEDTH